MKLSYIVTSFVIALGMSQAQAALTRYDITTTFLEPQTQPKNSIFMGSFNYNDSTHTISDLTGQLSESMTGSNASNMTWLALNNQLQSWYDSALGGTFAAVFKNTSTNTFWTGAGGDGWSPASGVAASGTYAGFPKAASNPGNAYALIFVPDNPLSPLTQAQLDKLAYADCAPGGMMGATCMTGTSVEGYGALGTMGGYPVSELITASVPEPSPLLLALLGIGVLALGVRATRQSNVR